MNLRLHPRQYGTVNPYCLLHCACKYAHATKFQASMLARALPRAASPPAMCHPPLLTHQRLHALRRRRNVAGELWPRRAGAPLRLDRGLRLEQRLERHDDFLDLLIVRELPT
eukprot:365720-Chlamydomonas_euryale.AAC.11